MMKKIQKGFTLTEIIIAIILTSMVGLLIGLVFNTMFSGRNIIEREASIQSEMRTSMQYVDRTIGKATSVFVLDESKYGKDDFSQCKTFLYFFHHSFLFKFFYPFT